MFSISLKTPAVNPKWLPANDVVVGGRLLTWTALCDQFTRRPIANCIRALNCPIALVAADRYEAVQALAAVAADRLDGLILERDRLTASVRLLLLERGFAIAEMATGEVSKPSTYIQAQPGRVWLLTSGSTGLPKLVPHRWETLVTSRSTASTVSEIPARRWLVPYQSGTYAWYQLVTLGLFRGGQTLVIPETQDIEATFADAILASVDSISATPTFWRLACFRVPEAQLRCLELRNISLGGELADQAILDRLASLFPAAAISHVYASTEVGACIVVKDGRAGFPAEFLARNGAGLPALRLTDGRLWVRSPFSTRAAEGEADEWVDTGDLVEVREGRALFVGRANTALINVGGNKAYPADIEAALLAHPGVRWCRVRAVRSPLVGHLPEADIVSATAPGPDDIELTRHCAARLPEYAVPRLWNRLAAIPVQGSLKAAL
jgi:acyl-CoA synthetase (AMP-forming)/AMP-acid ligase II